jgi:hypothetical protein
MAGGDVTLSEHAARMTTPKSTVLNFDKVITETSLPALSKLAASRPETDAANATRSLFVFQFK